MGFEGIQMMPARGLIGGILVLGAGFDTHLRDVAGFLEFHLLHGPEREDHVLYTSHTIWRSRADFEAWTRSEAFRLAHYSAGQNRPLYLGHPEFEGFEVIQTVKATGQGEV